jgi:hypothetical protein
MFVCPANTFDNVKGSFPIGFMIWKTDVKEKFECVTADVFDEKENNIGTKSFCAYDDSQYINDWIKPLRGKIGENNIGKFPFKGNDFQNQNLIAIVHPKMDYNVEAGQFLINAKNLIESCIYYSVRKVIPATWLNDRDQFLYPNEEWERDSEFKNDCFAYTLFNNNIQSKYGTNYWIPFTEQEVNARDKFESNFMTNFIARKKTFFGGGGGGSHRQMNMFMVFEPDVEYQKMPMKFSKEANEVFDAGRTLWRYYHAVPNGNVNASLYDIREYFQGRSDKGKMNNTSEDTQYTELIGNLRDKLKVLAKKIEPKVYEYGFLKK